MMPSPIPCHRLCVPLQVYGSRVVKVTGFVNYSLSYHWLGFYMFVCVYGKCYTRNVDNFMLLLTLLLVDLFCITKDAKAHNLSVLSYCSCFYS